MLAALTTAVLLATGTMDPIAFAEQRFNQAASYRTTVHSWSAHGARSEIRYSYRKPGYIRMDFLEPHRGATLIYNPNTHKVRVWPFGVGSLPALTLSPANPLLRDGSGHRVDQSDVGSLLRNIRTLQRGGEIMTLGEETLGRRPALHLAIKGAAGSSVAGIHRYQIWLDAGLGFPLRVISYAVGDEPLETVQMDDMEVNASFPNHFFDP
ncbi:DUF1571 domain-containing protein [Chromobacterium sphagni]|uniref:DUF1571 domain-containing protein n=1 Tax=Chromobacterium sphagni TaxID=1903179 RepID=A0A1S1WZH1_9NEIS|nr:DUF1571 domain-containing protein [Chromobacterium sphagni]OHX12549.1 DUF1571 domain-containing protein [Chromobacterium sphagni]OHX21367.1 DUF1571 domain-containing protein [Chromobacterium sphagni]